MDAYDSGAVSLLNVTLTCEPGEVPLIPQLVPRSHNDLAAALNGTLPLPQLAVMLEAPLVAPYDEQVTPCMHAAPDVQLNPGAVPNESMRHTAPHPPPPTPLRCGPDA